MSDLRGSTAAPGYVQGLVRQTLRAEGCAVMVASAFAYHALGGGWGWFALLFLVPDVSMVGYLRGPRLGATLYNLGHSYVGPAALLLASVASSNELMRLGVLIWTAHIGFDRMLGYGLKYSRAFTETHLGRTRREQPAAPESVASAGA